MGLWTQVLNSEWPKWVLNESGFFKFKIGEIGYTIR